MQGWLNKTVISWCHVVLYPHPPCGWSPNAMHWDTSFCITTTSGWLTTRFQHKCFIGSVSTVPTNLTWCRAWRIQLTFCRWEHSDHQQCSSSLGINRWLISCRSMPFFGDVTQQRDRGEASCNIMLYFMG